MKRLLTHLSCLTRLAMTLVLVLSAMGAGAQEVVGPGNTGYTLTLVPNYNGGQGEEITDVTSYRLPAFNRTNYDFMGWAESSGGDVKYAAGADITLTRNTTLFAKWIGRVDATFTVEGMTYTITSESPFEVALTVGKNESNVTIPASVTCWKQNYAVTSIEGHAFKNCTNLKTVTFSEGSQIRSIGDFAFDGCSSLTSIDLPAGVTSIGNNAFQKCHSLFSISIPAGVTSIGDNAFEGSASLKSIDLPASVTSIGIYAFSACHAMELATLHSNPTIGRGAFHDETNVTMTLPANPANGAYWATFCNYSGYNFQADGNTTVYKATVDTENMQLKLHEVGNRIVNKETAVILKSSVDHPVMTLTTGSSTDTHENDLRGEPIRKASVHITGGTIYVMGKPEGKVMGFYEYTGTYMPANKAYIALAPSAGAPTRGLSFVEEEVTNIVSVDSGQLTVDSWYTLSGVKLEGEPTERGVYIHNGRKEVVR